MATAMAGCLFVGSTTTCCLGMSPFEEAAQIPELFLGLEKATFLVNGGVVKSSWLDAAEYIMRRDFPEVDLNNQSKVLAIPPIIPPEFGDLPPTSQILAKLPLFKNKQKDDKVKSDLTTPMKGFVHEQVIHEAVFKACEKWLLDQKRANKNVTIIHNWRRELFPGYYDPDPDATDKGKQHDFIIVDGTNKVVILLETKFTFGLAENNTPSKNIIKAIEQTEIQAEFFKANFSHLLGPDWQLVTAMGCQLSRIPESCIHADCKPFFIYGQFSNQSAVDQDKWIGQVFDSNLAHSLESLLRHCTTHRLPDTPQTKPDAYKNLVGSLVPLSKAKWNFNTQNTVDRPGGRKQAEFTTNLADSKKKIYSAIVGTGNTTDVSTGHLNPATNWDVMCHVENASNSQRQEGKTRKRPKHKKQPYPMGRSEGSADVVMFWTEEQQKILLKNATKVSIGGCYGAGKTLLLKEKAAQLSQEIYRSRATDRKVFFCVGSTISTEAQVDPMHTVLTRDGFSKNRNLQYVEVMTVRHQKEILDCITKYPNCDILVDEFVGFDENDVSNIITAMKHERCFWFALPPHCPISGVRADKALLTNNLRNHYYVNHFIEKERTEKQERWLQASLVEHDSLLPYIVAVQEDSEWEDAIHAGLKHFQHDDNLLIIVQYKDCGDLAESIYPLVIKACRGDSRTFLNYTSSHCRRASGNVGQKLLDTVETGDDKNRFIILTDSYMVDSVEANNVMVIHLEFNPLWKSASFRAVVSLAFLAPTTCLLEDKDKIVQKYRQKYPQKVVDRDGNIFTVP